MPTIKIASRYDSTKVLFECEVTKAQQASGAAMRHALEKATAAKSDLSGADLRDADLRGANLSDANLGGANLSGANLSDKKLAGARPFIQIGPIGSRSDYLQAFITDTGLMVRAGCFFDTREKFELQIAETHGDNKHAQEYRAALALIDKHAELWLADATKTEAVEMAA